MKNRRETKKLKKIGPKSKAIMACRATRHKS